jgi:NADH-quinone oxidoreductase subunit J
MERGLPVRNQVRSRNSAGKDARAPTSAIRFLDFFNSLGFQPALLGFENHCLCFTISCLFAMKIIDVLHLAGFYLFALMTVISAFIVVLSRNILRSVFALLFTLFGVAGLFLFLRADFLAATQVLIYVGGVLVLFLFGIMLTQRMVEGDVRSGKIQFTPSLVAMGILFTFLLFLIFQTPWGVKGPANFEQTTRQIGVLLMTNWLLPFEIASILLLAALVGAVSIARKKRTPE